MRREKNIPDFRDSFAVTKEYTDNATSLTMVEVKYGARNEENQPIEITEGVDNYGQWTAIHDKSYYVVYYKRAPYEGGEVEIDERDHVAALLKQRAELVEQSKALSDSTDYRETMQAYKKLLEDWKTLERLHIPYEQVMWNEFITPMNKFYESVTAYQQENASKKQELIEKVKGFAENVNQVSTNRVKALQKQWREIGYAGKTNDNALWNEFKTACDDFFAKKHEAWEANVHPALEKAFNAKKQLIEEAVEAANMDNFKEGTAKFRSLMAQWKKAGYAGEDDQKLWDEFNTHQQVFYNKKQAYYDKIQDELEDNYKAKRALVQEAKDIVNKCEYDRDYSYERTNRMKEIMSEWKEIGFAGRDKDNQLWTALRKEMDQYFEESRKYAIFNRRY
ncbi:MAG: DUF349 domain-containing protein [Erysipelotrichaceae bacterium]|nr:DUF349 domain-containing protein [Erysipelotrichaceae bacterium]